MSLDSLIRQGVAVADRLTASLQDSVVFFAWIGSGSEGEPEYAAPISIPAVVEEKEYLRKLSSGEEVTQKASITIPRPVPPNGAANRKEPIDPRDQIILPSGYTGPILDVAGVVDPSTHQPYMLEVVLG